MKNYEASIKYANSVEEQKLFQTEYILTLKNQLLAAENLNMRHLIDAPFTGGPRFATVIAQSGGGKTATLLWLATKHFYVLPSEKITVFSEIMPQHIESRLGRFGFQGQIEATMKTPNFDDIRAAIASSAVVIFDQPIGNSLSERVQDLYHTVREACFKDNKYHKCRGLLFGIQGVRHDPASPVASMISLKASDIVFHANLQGDGGAPFIRTTKSRFLTTELPTFYMIPQQIIKAFD